MSAADELPANNARYAETFEGSLPLSPVKRLAGVACMDARLDVYAILGLNEGDEISSLAISQRLLDTEGIVLRTHQGRPLRRARGRRPRLRLRRPHTAPNAQSRAAVTASDTITPASWIR